MGKYKAVILVIIQIICLGYLAITGPMLPSNFYMWILYLLGLILGIWAVIKMVLVSKLRVTPGIAQGSKLVTDGPYKYVRHPMYSGVLLAGLSLVINYPNILRVIILAILVVDLVIKMNYEEILLKIYFSDYKVYKRFTWKLIPYLY